MKSRLGLAKQLPPLTPEQREHLLRRQLPQDHELTPADVRDVMEKVPLGSIRQLQGLGTMIVNCARDEQHGHTVPVLLKHVELALAELKENEDLLAQVSHSNVSPTVAREREC